MEPERDDPSELFQLSRTPPKPRPRPIEFGNNAGRQRELWPGCREDLPGQRTLFESCTAAEE